MLDGSTLSRLLDKVSVRLQGLQPSVRLAAMLPLLTLAAQLPHGVLHRGRAADAAALPRRLLQRRSGVGLARAGAVGAGDLVLDRFQGMAEIVAQAFEPGLGAGFMGVGIASVGHGYRLSRGSNV